VARADLSNPSQTTDRERPSSLAIKIVYPGGLPASQYNAWFFIEIDLARDAFNKRPSAAKYFCISSSGFVTLCNCLRGDIEVVLSHALNHEPVDTARSPTLINPSIV
jgi:hypothetical protein